MKILRLPYYKVMLYPDRFGGTFIQKHAHELEEAGFDLDKPISVHQDYKNADIVFEQQEENPNENTKDSL